MRFHLGLIVIAACSSSGDSVPADKSNHAAPAVTASGVRLDIVIGDVTSTWNQDAFERVAHHVSPNHRGEGRDTWSLRDLVHQLVGPSARVIAVTGADGTKQIDAATWDAADRTPILHKTGRGTLKFRWTDPAGTWGETEVSDVSRLEIAR